MKLEIKGYLENETDTSDVWVKLDELYDTLNPHDHTGEVEITPEQQLRGVTFVQSISEMVVDREVRINENKDGSFSVALESFIQDILNVTKKSAIVEMEEELQKYVDDEDFEKAAEYRDMIVEYKDKLN